MIKHIKMICVLFFALFNILNYNASYGQTESTTALVRIAEIQVDSNFIEEYKGLLAEEASISMDIEKGVVCIFPMFDKKNPTQIRILEIYSDQQAYESHLKTSHFLKYKNETKHMVTSLRLPDMQPIDVGSMKMIFLKHTNKTIQ